MHSIGGGKQCEFWGAKGWLVKQLIDWGLPVPQEQGGYSEPPQQLERVQETITNNNKQDQCTRRGGAHTKIRKQQQQEQQESERSGQVTIPPLGEEGLALDQLVT